MILNIGHRTHFVQFPDYKIRLAKLNVKKSKLNENVNERIEWLGKELGVKKLDDWYTIQVRDVILKGGSSLLTQYNGSLQKLLISIYPSHSWKIWKFKSVPKGYWNDVKNQREFLNWLSEIIRIKKIEEWYSIRTIDIRENGGYGLLQYYGHSLTNIFSSLFPGNKQYFEK
jgi:hypothetical protein